MSEMTKEEIWQHYDYIDPNEEYRCANCEKGFLPWIDMENEEVEFIWCKDCVDSEEFLCVIFKGVKS